MKIPLAVLVVSFLAVPYQQGYGAEIREEIYRGTPAQLGQFPYQALLLSSNKTGPANSYYTCGGALISKTYILTAGHCTYGYYMTDVFLGVISTTDLLAPGSFHDQFLISDNVVLHPKYKPANVYDIAIVRLNNEPTLSATIKTIALPMYSWRAIDHYKNQFAMVSGFGNKYEGDTSPATLDYTKQIIMPQEECKAIYNDLKDYVICTEKKKINSGPCKGDSGGPLTVDVNLVPYVVGLVSYGKLQGCNDSYPEGYTNVAYFLPFIKKVTGLPYKN